MGKNMSPSDIAKVLLSKNCVQLSTNPPFTYASGLKGPIYCDNRLLWSHVDARLKIIEAFKNICAQKSLEFDAFCGLATAGIPHASILAWELKKPLMYVRGSSKGHGKQNQVEGDVRPGMKVLLIEDLVNQGKSLGDAIISVKAVGLEPIGCLTIVDYETSGARAVLKEHDLALHSLTNFTSLVESAESEGILSANEVAQAKSWQANPKEWEILS
ncbi:MAG: orotate phosphoribosyltransferase [Halobacteriovorax sp.]|nr:orotate phosphoribosyltransferase [Halobacteriovorax sp.]